MSQMKTIDIAEGYQVVLPEDNAFLFATQRPDGQWRCSYKGPAMVAMDLVLELVDKILADIPDEDLRMRFVRVATEMMMNHVQGRKEDGNEMPGLAPDVQQ